MTQAIEPEVLSPDQNGSDAITTTQHFTVEDLMARAIDKGDVATMEKLFAMRREMKAERAKEAFFAALAEFQRECPVIKRTRAVKSESGRVLYYYAPLDSIITQAGPLIAKHGLSYRVEAHFEEGTDKSPLGRILATCKIQHKDGHVEETSFPIPIREATKFTNAPQQYGTALQYAKRYAFSDGFGIVTADEDTDGVGGDRTTETITADQVKTLRDLAKETESSIPRFCAYFQIDALENLPASMYESAVKAFQKKGKTAEAKPKPPVISAAADGEGIDAAAVKELRAKMDSAALSTGDFKARFGLGSLEEVKQSDVTTVINWILNPQSA